MNIKVKTQLKKQQFQGFGTSLSWWANIVGSWDMKGKSGKEVREEICDLVFDEKKVLV